MTSKRFRRQRKREEGVERRRKRREAGGVRIVTEWWLTGSLFILTFMEEKESSSVSGLDSARKDEGAKGGGNL